MKKRRLFDRRHVLAGAAAGATSLILGGCDRLYRAPAFRDFLSSAEGLTYRFQRAAISREALAREYGPEDISRVFRANGSQDPVHLPPGYYEAIQTGTLNWNLEVSGLVMRPTRFSVEQLRALPARTQITRHDCVEGWSCIGSWTGVPLSTILERVGLRAEARFIVFYCADGFPRYREGGNIYYESIDLIDAFHPQTILAYDMNGGPLPFAHGAPLRLRLERQLGYKMAKFLARIEAVDRLDNIGGGQGGYWEDQGYEWYAGI